MFTIDGVPIYSASDFRALKVLPHFRHAVVINGWTHEKHNVWRGDMAGEAGLTIAEWVSRQTLIRTSAIVQATRYTNAHISKVANDNDLKPESKGRWRIETVAQLLKVLGRLAKCPKCRGVAGLDGQGEATCLECKE